MSYFKPEENSNQEGTQTEDFVQAIIQEKGEQWKDPQVLAKGYAASQEHIAKLETELSALQSQAEKQDYMKEVLDQVKQAQSPSTKELVSNTSGTPKVDDQPQVGVEQINELVKEAMTKQEADRTASQNLQAADAELVKQFGTDAQNIVESKRQELGLSKERLAQIAQESPTAFLALVGGTSTQQKSTSTTTTSTVNTSSPSFNQAGKRDFAYYNDLRKTQPKLYRSAQIQDQMVKDRTDLGADKFYN